MRSAPQSYVLIAGFALTLLAFYYQPKVVQNSDLGTVRVGYRAIDDDNKMVSDNGQIAVELATIAILTTMAYRLFDPDPR